MQVILIEETAFFFAFFRADKKIIICYTLNKRFGLIRKNMAGKIQVPKIFYRGYSICFMLFMLLFSFTKQSIASSDAFDDGSIENTCKYNLFLDNKIDTARQSFDPDPFSIIQTIPDNYVMANLPAYNPSSSLDFNSYNNILPDSSNNVNITGSPFIFETSITQMPGDCNEIANAPSSIFEQPIPAYSQEFNNNTVLSPEETLGFPGGERRPYSGRYESHKDVATQICEVTVHGFNKIDPKFDILKKAICNEQNPELMNLAKNNMLSVEIVPNLRKDNGDPVAGLVFSITNPVMQLDRDDGLNSSVFTHEFCHIETKYLMPDGKSLTDATNDYNQKNGLNYENPYSDGFASDYHPNVYEDLAETCALSQYLERGYARISPDSQIKTKVDMYNTYHKRLLQSLK